MMQLAVVVVLYKQTPAESTALRMLLAGLRGREQFVRLLIYDNSPSPQDISLDCNIIGDIHVGYCHDPSNGRLFAAYSYALEWVAREGVSWLMLLDQDTEVTLEYLDEALRLCSTTPAGICAITPRLIVHGEQRSPHLLHERNGDGKAPAKDNALPPGKSDERLGAWNSGAILRVASLVAIGGFPKEFPLDNLDYALFLMLQQGDDRVFVMKSRLNHQLSVADLHSLSADRLRGKLASDILLQRRFQQKTRLSLAVEFLRTGLSLLRKLPDKRMGLMCLRFSLACLFSGAD